MKTKGATREALEAVEAHCRELRSELPSDGLGDLDALAYALTALRGIRYVGFEGFGRKLTMAIHTEDPEPRRGQVRQFVRGVLKRRGVAGWSRLKFRFSHVEEETEAERLRMEDAADQLLRSER